MNTGKLKYYLTIPLHTDRIKSVGYTERLSRRVNGVVRLLSCWFGRSGRSAVGGNAQMSVSSWLGCDYQINSEVRLPNSHEFLLKLKFIEFFNCEAKRVY